MSKQNKFIILLIVVVFVSVFGVILSLGSDSKEDWIATDVEPVNPHYLTSGGEESKIFLVNASARYSFWRENDTIIGYIIPPGQAHEFPVVRTGDPMFIITATVRNDYPSEESIFVDYRASRDEYFSYVGLSAKLYAEDGSEISALNTDDRKGWEGYLFTLGVNETKTVEIPFATGNRNIAYYDIWPHYIYAFPK
jgi:hypothetical protein